MSIIDTLSTFIGIGERISQLPARERQYYREAVSKTYRVLDKAIGLPIEKLTQILGIPDKQTFVNELRLLKSFTKWRDKERDVKLCEPLRIAGAEMDATPTKLKDMLSIRDRDELRNLINRLQAGETGIAYLIRSSVENLADMADNVDNSSEGYEKAKEALRNKINSLDNTRQELHASELRFHEALSTRAPTPNDKGQPEKKSWFKRFFHNKK